MKINFASSLDLTLSFEDGFRSDPKDMDSASNKGILLQTFRAFYGEEMTKHDLATIEADQIVHIYRRAYWDKCRCDDLPGGVDCAIFDAAVSHGPSQAAKWLQESIFVDMDGIIGPVTIRKARNFHPEIAIHRVSMYRLRYLQTLSMWADIGAKWAERVVDVEYHALDMRY